MSAPEEDLILTPPSAERVVRRSLALCAIVCRAFIEIDAGEDLAKAIRQETLDWVRRLGLEAELESEEASLVSAPLGVLKKQQQANGTWRCEGLAILAWALKQFELPPYDQPVDPKGVTDSLGFLSDKGRGLLRKAPLRKKNEILRYANLAFQVHWRLREFSLRPVPIDLAAMANHSWFGPLEIPGLRLVRGDLAIGKKPIAEASAEDFRRSFSIARERHQAANWLCGRHPIFSQVTTDT